MFIVEREVRKDSYPNVVVGTALIRIAGPFHAGRFANVDVTIYNHGGSAFNACSVRSSPDVAAGTNSPLWKVEDSTTFASLTNGTALNRTFPNNARLAYDVIASVVAGTTYADVFLTGN